MDRRRALALIAAAAAGPGPAAQASPVSGEPHPDTLHTPWSAPGAHGTGLDELPGEPAALADALEGLVIHRMVELGRGRSIPREAAGDFLCRRVERLLAAALARDARSLRETRPPARRLHGTCHTYAMLSVAALRNRGTPARLRVGFAAYLAPGLLEDHWICEHRTDERWSRLDANMGPVARAALGLAFDVADLPPGAWLPAAAVWRGIRRGEIDPRRCGISFGGVAGRGYVAGALLRDAAALAGIELLPGDLWGPMLRARPGVPMPEEEEAAYDALAAALHPEPRDREAARAVLDRFPWARPGPTVRNVLAGPPGIEVRLDEA